LQQRLEFYGHKINDEKGYYGEDTKKAVLKIENKIYKIEYAKNEYIPLRSYFEDMGYIVDWYNSVKSVILSKDNQYIKLSENKNIVLNDNIINTDYPIKIGNGTTFVSGEIIENILCDGNLNNYELKELNDMFLEDLNKSDNQLNYAIRLWS